METIKTSNPEIQAHTEDGHSLKGTMVAVGFVLAFIIVSWVAVFGLYLSRV